VQTVEERGDMNQNVARTGPAISARLSMLVPGSAKVTEQ